MLTNAYLLAKIGADTAESEQHFAEMPERTASDGRHRRARRAPVVGSGVELLGRAPLPLAREDVAEELRGDLCVLAKLITFYTSFAYGLRKKKSARSAETFFQDIPYLLVVCGRKRAHAARKMFQS